MGIPIPVPAKITGNFPGIFFVTKIHRESHSHINMHTITTWYFSCIFLVTTLLAKLPNTSTRGLLPRCQDHSRLLPGGLSSSEGPTVASKVLSSH